MARSWRWLSLGAAAAALSVSGTGAALAGSPAAGASGPGALLVPQGAGASFVPALAPAAAAAATTNNEEAGYRVIDSKGIKKFHAVMMVPAISCPSSGTYSGYLSSQVVGTTVSGGSFVHLACTAGAATYAGFIIYTTVTKGVKDFSVAAGNTIESLIVETVVTGKTKIHTTITDKTTGVTTNKWVTYTGVAKDTTGWDVFEHLDKTSVPPFTSSHWYGARSNRLTLAAAGAKHFNMTQTGTVLVSASPLAVTGASFTVTFHTSA